MTVHPAPAADVDPKKEKAQLAALRKIFGHAQVALVELRRVRKVDDKSLNEPFTL